MLVPYKSWKKYNEFQLTKNKMDLNTRKWKIIHPHPKRGVTSREWCLLLLFSLVLIAGTSPQKSISARREQVPFSMAIGNVELMRECFPKHPRMGTAR